VLRSKRARLDRDALQARVPEQLLAAGRCRTTGAAGPVSSTRTGDHPPVWVGVSRERIYAFEVGSDSVGELVGTWDRDRASVQTSPTRTTTRLSLGFSAHGPRLELVTHRLRISDRRLARYLLDPSRTT